MLGRVLRLPTQGPFLLARHQGAFESTLSSTLHPQHRGPSRPSVYCLLCHVVCRIDFEFSHVTLSHGAPAGNLVVRFRVGFRINLVGV